MPDNYLACPRCGSLKFFVWGEDGTMIFFQVNRDLQPVPTGGNSADLSPADFSPIHCTGCSWSGEMSELSSVV